jgi:putative glycosyltransferase (TIGR04348 family)
MKISMVTPAAKRARTGNRATALRWARLLRDLGYRVLVSESWEGQKADCLVAIHAWRSAASIARFKQTHPERPLVVLLAGTDIYTFQHSHPGETLTSMETADRLVGLHDFVAEDIPKRFGAKLRIIHQSAESLARPRRPSRARFDVCVAGHLRNEKDPLRAALAAREMPANSRIRVVQVGKPHDEAWRKAAEAEVATNPRYEWRGEVPRWQVRRLYGKAHLMAISSLQEGGANVVSEAVVADLPVVASDIAGNRGLLGPDHPAYFPPRDTSALAELLYRAEREAGFLEAITDSGRRRAHLFTAARERDAWRCLLAEIM